MEIKHYGTIKGFLMWNQRISEILVFISHLFLGLTLVRKELK